MWLWVYLAGVVVGLVATRDRLMPRLVTALAWPLGPLAFVAVMAVLIPTAFVLWPVPLLAAAGAGVAIWYLIGS